MAAPAREPAPPTALHRGPLRRVVIVRATDIDPDPRAEKTARWVAAAGHAVRIFGWARSAATPASEVRDGVPITRAHIPAAYGAGLRTLGPLLRWQLAVAWHLLRRRRDYDCIHACDFDTALPAFIVSRLLRKRLVYDIYDFYIASRPVPERVREAVRRLELAVAVRADAVIIVDESRVEQLAPTALARLEVVYNTPDAACPPAGLAPVASPGALRIVFVGTLADGRGLDEMLDVLARRPEWHLDLGGFGEGGQRVVAHAASLPNVTFHGRVPYERTVALSAAADVLFATYDPRVPNHRYSSANKLFEAMMLGKPIVVARGTGMDRTVERYGLGAVVEYGDRDALECALAGFATWGDAERAEFARSARAVYERHFSAAAMRARLSTLYAAI